MLDAGSRLGPYQITAPIGSGGMGDVYRARDTRLGRSVAIKVLSGHVSDDPALKKRFLREARAISSLNHPNICALYDIGSDGGQDYLVMELLEGETLAERLARGPMPLSEALRIASEIAAALDRAHRQGVIHRDLKPSNILLTTAGAKLVDFGLAHLAEVGAGESSAGPLTVEGTLLGTIEYMAPEQLNGGVVDARTDIFSFGSMLYEMLSGMRPFGGQNQASVIGSILFAVPELVTLKRPDLPVAVERLLQACLEKSPDDRVQTARDLRRELEWIAEGATEPRPRATAKGRRLRKVIAAAALVVMGAGAAAALYWFADARWRRAEEREIRFTLTSPVPGTQLDWPTLSPDGTRIAFIAVASDGKSSLWIRDLASTSARQVPGSEGAMQAFWSPSGSALGFFARAKLLTFTLGAASPQPIQTASAPRGGTWGADGAILFVPYISTGIFMTSSVGSTPREITHLSRAERDVSHRWPEFLPDGRRFLYVIQSRSLQRSGLYLGEIDAQRSRKIANIQTRAIVTADSYLMYVSKRRLYRQRFDLDREELVGSPEVIAENVNVDLKVTGATALSVARDGSFLWLSKPDARSELVWVDRAGRREGSIGPARYYVNPSLSPDGRRIAVSVIDEETGRNSVDLVDVNSGATTPLIADESNADAPTWSPAGDQLAYASDRRGEYDVFARPVLGVAADRPLFAPGGYAAPLSWRSSGMLIQRARYAGGANGLWIRQVNGVAREIMKSDYGQADLSPDGQWLLCVLHSEDTARSEVFVQSITNPERRRQLSTGGGGQPAWRADGRELYFIDSSLHLVAVSFRDGNPGAPQPLFATPLPGYATYANHDYSPSPDGKRFLLNVPVARQQTATATVVIRAR